MLAKSVGLAALAMIGAAIFLITLSALERVSDSYGAGIALGVAGVLTVLCVRYWPRGRDTKQHL